MKKILALFFILWFGHTCCLAQEPLLFRLRHHIPVSTPAGPLASPWSGGLNTPQFSTIDLNIDGQPDLFIYDRMLRKVYTWLAVEENGNWQYTYAPAYETFFPEDLDGWVLLRDYNCDGLKDIFTSTPLGIRVYKQEATAAGELKFSLEKSYLTYGDRNVNMQMNAVDIPVIEDMDGDGDLDVLVTEFSTGYMIEHYRNTQAEEGQECGSLAFVQESNWWGGITECDGCNNFKFNEHCFTDNSGRVAAPLHSGHDGSSMLLLDMDDDGDKDLIMGSVQCPNLVLMENKGDRNNAVMTGFEQSFPKAKPTSFNLFPSAYYEDVTFDGVPDMLVAPSAMHELQDINFEQSVWLYENQGRVTAPVFNYMQSDFLQNQMIDVSEGAYPAFADLNGDGALDMLLGNEVAYRNDIYSASISYYQNTGTTTAPAFMLVTDDYLNLASKQLQSIKPAFADINADGALDLVLTYKSQRTGANKIYYLPNTASKEQAANFNFNNQQTLFEIGAGDSPAFFDADEDGKLDFILGKANGTLQYYRNTGTAHQPVYTLEQNNVGGIGINFDRRSVYPTIVDVDGDRKPDLLTVDDRGRMSVYRNITANLSGNFVAEEELLENELINKTLATRFGRGLSITVAPLGGEGNLYAVVGSSGGGLYLLEQTSGYDATPVNSNNILRLQVFPNPADKSMRESVGVKAAEPVALEVYNVTGQIVYRTGRTYSASHNLPLRYFSVGLYIIRATTAQSSQQAAVKLIVR